MFNVGFPELLAILALALIILGPAKLPDAVRTAGRVMGELRRISGGFQQELLNALEDSQPDADLEQPSDTRADPPVGPTAEAGRSSARAHQDHGGGRTAPSKGRPPVGPKASGRR